MHKNSEDIVNSLSQEEHDLENFFSGGGRAEVLVRLQEAISVGVPMLVLTGEEGSGKTMLCRMLERRTAEAYVVVYFPETIESFEDGIRIVARKLGISSAEIVGGNELRNTIEQIVELLLRENRRVLIILDKAENIYLATLERIRKLLDQMIEAGVEMHVLFSGRSSFLENFDQLLICDFREIEELHFSLEPLSDEETSTYLKSCIDRQAGGTEVDMFSDEVVEKISSVAKGNFRMVNILAEESLATPVDDSSFMVLLDSVAKEGEPGDTGWTWPQNISDLKRFVPLLPWIGGTIGILFVLILFFTSGDENGKEVVIQPKETGESVILPEPVIKDEPVITAEPVAKDDPVAEKLAKTAKPTIVIDKEKVPSEEKAASVEKVGEVEKKERVEKEAGEDKALVAEVIPEVKEEATEKDVTTAKEIQVTRIVLEKKKETIHIGSPVELPLQDEPVIELHQSSTLKKKVGISETVKRRKIKVQPRTEVQKSMVTNAHFTVDQLYASRIAAGREWKYGIKDNMYTIQLMVLTSQNAEENLKQMLSQENYRRQAPHFYIFQKNGSHAVHLVFYGEYRTIAEARRAQKNIPTFLQKHKPYAISIKGAVAKVKK